MKKPIQIMDDKSEKSVELPLEEPVSEPDVGAVFVHSDDDLGAGISDHDNDEGIL